MVGRRCLTRSNPRTHHTARPLSSNTNLRSARRHHVSKVGGATTAAVLFGWAAMASSSTAAAAAAAPSEVDVVVVGAGISGLVAASRLHEQGFTVAVVEGRDRIGGR